MSRAPQSFENHGRRVPLYHYVLAPLGLLVLAWFAYRAVTDPSVDHVMLVLLASAVFGVGYSGRVFALGVQDRVIRLEERLRMERLFPEGLRDRIPELTTRQFVALRFASDEELEELTRRVLDGELTGQVEIKRAVRTWRADHQRI